MHQFSAATALIPHTTGAYRHFFSGLPKMAEPDPFSVKAPAHLLYDIDLADPLIPSLPLRGVQRLLLVYPFRYEGAALNYQITPNGSIAGILRSKNDEPTKSWPYHGYPVSFPRISVSMQKIADGTTIKAEPIMPPLIFGDLLATPNGSGRDDSQLERRGGGREQVPKRSLHRATIGGAETPHCSYSEQSGPRAFAVGGA
jgi:hypothetical protein